MTLGEPSIVARYPDLGYKNASGSVAIEGY